MKIAEDLEDSARLHIVKYLYWHTIYTGIYTGIID